VQRTVELAVAVAVESVTAQARIEDLTIDDLDELERLADVAPGEFTVAAWRLRDAVRARRTALADAHTDDARQPAADRHDRAGDEYQQTDADAAPATSAVRATTPDGSAVSRRSAVPGPPSIAPMRVRSGRHRPRSRRAPRAA
jgi:hypothetical protein